MARIEAIAHGSNLDDLAYWGNIDELPYTFDDPVWQDAHWYIISDTSDANFEGEEDMLIGTYLFSFGSDAEVHGGIEAGINGWDWVTRAI